MILTEYCLSTFNGQIKETTDNKEYRYNQANIYNSGNLNLAVNTAISHQLITLKKDIVNIGVWSIYSLADFKI